MASNYPIAKCRRTLREVRKRLDVPEMESIIDYSGLLMKEYLELRRFKFKHEKLDNN